MCGPVRLLLPLPHAPLLLLQSPVQEVETPLLPPPRLRPLYTELDKFLQDQNSVPGPDRFRQQQTPCIDPDWFGSALDQYFVRRLTGGTSELIPHTWT